MLMKDGLGASAIQRISAALYELMGEHFPQKKFEKQALRGLDALELKQRVEHLIVVLHDFLPDSISECGAILSALPEVWDRGDENDALSGFAAWPLTDYLANHGLSDPEVSLDVLKRLTPLFSAEFAIRPFIIEHPKTTLQYLRLWRKDPDEHVRRLVSEGMRPRLPWGIQLKKYVNDPAEIIPFLNALRCDRSEYVRRSVANNLNDISKDHPDRVIDVCDKWQRQDKGNSDWVIRHATRTLIKQGNPKVFPLLGYAKNPKIKIDNFKLKKGKVKMGEDLAFTFELIGLQKREQHVVVDFAVHYKKANGSLAPKVFKLKNVVVKKDDVISIDKTVSFKKITTRKFYKGEHLIAIHINGVENCRMPFLLQ